jgi:hypothetical protein
MRQEEGKDERRRGQRREAVGLSVELPPVEAGHHLVECLWEIGPSMPTGMGNAPVTFTEMQAWQQQTGSVLDAWEARTLRRMSVAYVTQAHEAAAPDCPAPWMPAPTASERDQSRVGPRIRAVLRA